MSYLKIRDEAVKQIKEGMQKTFPKITVEAHPGAFTETSIRQSARRTPAILTSLVKAVDGTRANGITFVSWVLYRASGGDRLHDGAMKIVSELIAVIRNADFDLDIKETVAEAECLYSGTLDAMNVTMWAVRWELVLGGRAPPPGSAERPDDLEYMDVAEILGSAQMQSTIQEE